MYERRLTWAASTIRRPQTAATGLLKPLLIRTCFFRNRAASPVSFAGHSSARLVSRHVRSDCHPEVGAARRGTSHQPCRSHVESDTVPNESGWFGKVVAGALIPVTRTRLLTSSEERSPTASGNRGQRPRATISPETWPLSRSLESGSGEPEIIFGRCSRICWQFSRHRVIASRLGCTKGAGSLTAFQCAHTLRSRNGGVAKW